MCLHAGYSPITSVPKWYINCVYCICIYEYAYVFSSPPFLSLDGCVCVCGMSCRVMPLSQCEYLSVTNLFANNAKTRYITPHFSLTPAPLALASPFSGMAPFVSLHFFSFFCFFCFFVSNCSETERVFSMLSSS